MNAVVHADYAQRGSPIRIAVFADRIEIDSPGLLVPGLTIDDLWRGVSKLRNHVVGRVFHELTLMEEWGSGIRRMRAECENAGLAAPLLEEIGTQFRVTLSSLAVRTPELTELDTLRNDLGGEGGIRTHEHPLRCYWNSSPAPSTARPPLRIEARMILRPGPADLAGR